MQCIVLFYLWYIFEGITFDSVISHRKVDIDTTKCINAVGHRIENRCSVYNISIIIIYHFESRLLKVIVCISSFAGLESKFLLNF